MEYTWKVNSLKRKRLLAKLLKDDELVTLFQSLINSANIENNKFNKEDILVMDERKDIDIHEAGLFYSTGIEYIPESIYEDFHDIFTWFEDINSLKEDPEFEKISMTDDELVTLAYDIIKSMGDVKALRVFENLIDKKNHLLNIQDATNSVIGATERTGGVTYKNPISKNSYVNIFRNHTIEDVEYLVHEGMHFILNYMLYEDNELSYVRYLKELEGRFGSLYTAHYLDDLGYKEGALNMRKYEINSILTSSFLLMVNHSLFTTVHEGEFHLDEAENCINSYLKDIKVSILPEELPKYLTIQSFETITNMLSYLVALEIYEREYFIFDKIYALRINEKNSIMDTIQKEGCDFQGDLYRKFIKEYKLTHKIENT